ncbi:MAG: ATP-binding cassette domain-containing protein [Halothece sp.]
MNHDSEIILEANQISLTDPLGLTTLLNDISFHIQERDRAVLLGASGSGKTSLLRLLNRLSDPTSGQLFYRGTPYNQLSVISLRQNIVLVSQEPKLLGMTVSEALAYPLKIQKLSSLEIKTRLTTYCEQLKLPENWYEKSELELSLGQRQLVTIARGLVMQPDILLLDEPTSALDIATASRVLEILKQQDMTIIMVNHQFDIAQHFSDQVFYLQEGMIQKTLLNNNLDWEALKTEIIRQEKQLEQEWG